MNFKTTILLILCLAIAGVAVWFTRNEKPTEEKPPAPAKVIDVASADVTKLSITPASDKPIVLEKQGSHWRMLEPVNAAADDSSVDELVSNLTSLDSHGKTDTSGADADVTGLASPRYRVEITDKNGKTVKLAVGKPTAVGDELYVQKEGEKQADRVASTLYTSLNKPASGFRDLKLLDVQSTQIKSMQIEKGTEKFSLDHKGSEWEIATTQPAAPQAPPTTMPADESDASDLAMGLSSLRANEFVAEKSDDAKRYGLDAPQLVVNFTWQPLATPTSTQPSTQPAENGFVKFGRYQDLRKQNVYVQTSASSAVAIIPAASMTKFDKKPLDLRDKNVLRLDKASVDSISIVTNKPATTQPTTRAAEETTLTIVRNKEVPAQPLRAPFALPDSSATTQSMTQPTSQASTQSSTEPSTQASTEPSTNPTTVASSQPATNPSAPPAKWLITTEPKGPADEAAVDALLTQLSPLRVEKFLEKNPTTQPSDQYTLTVTTSNGTYTIHLTDPGGSKNPIGEYNGLTFEVPRFFLEKVTGKFTLSATSPSTETPPNSPTPMP